MVTTWYCAVQATTCTVWTERVARIIVIVVVVTVAGIGAKLITAGKRRWRAGETGIFMIPSHGPRDLDRRRRKQQMKMISATVRPKKTTSRRRSVCTNYYYYFFLFPGTDKLNWKDKKFTGETGRGKNRFYFYTSLIAIRTAEFCSNSQIIYLKKNNFLCCFC